MKKFLLLAMSIFVAGASFSQSKTISLKKASKQEFVLTKSLKSDDVLDLHANISSIKSSEKNTKSGNFIEIESEGLIKTFNVGKPNIPVYSKLIELPLDAKVTFEIVSYDEEIIDLSENGITEKIMPAQPSLSKSEDPKDLIYDEKVYGEDKYFNEEVSSFEEVGIFRSARMGRIEISPIQYNPVQNKLRVLNNLKVKIKFVGSNHSKTQELKAKYSSSLFDNVIDGYISESKVANKQLITETITYVIVSDRMFQSTLAPFIAHKQQLGYNVIVGYTDQSNVGNTTTSIKTYLEGLYNNPPSGMNAPHYVLFVGDVAQIPSFTSGAHVSDLYYCDYTNDNIPDVFYGRFSATNTSQLQSQINKTLEYAQNTMPDPSYISNAVLVAGNDASHELTWGNGQVNYGANQYFNASNGINASVYLQDEPSGANYAANIIADINDGVGFANYSAHCSSSGWSSPSFSTSDIASLTNEHKYGLWVGNCCRSNRFNDSETFGEAALRAVNKGAIGYIGGSDYTYWDEDFWWAVGFKTVTANPSYDANHLGAFDRMFHSHGESTSEWYSTQGQLMVGGNLAVQESTSSRKLYYWEIYHLMGDPSLYIRIVPTDCEANLTVTENISGGTHEYQASSTVNMSSTISNNANVHVGANNTSTLNPGFSIQLGSQITVDDDGCN